MSPAPASTRKEPSLKKKSLRRDLTKHRRDAVKLSDLPLFCIVLHCFAGFNPWSKTTKHCIVAPLKLPEGVRI